MARGIDRNRCRVLTSAPCCDLFSIRVMKDLGCLIRFQAYAMKAFFESADINAYPISRSIHDKNRALPFLEAPSSNKQGDVRVLY